MNVDRGADKALFAISLLETRMASEINGDRYWKGHAGLAYLCFMAQGMYRLPKPHASVQACDLLLTSLATGLDKEYSSLQYFGVFFHLVSVNAGTEKDTHTSQQRQRTEGAT